MQNREDDPLLKEKVQRLMEFLRELVKARTRPVRDLDRHDSVLWLDDGSLVGLLKPEASAGEVLVRARRVVLEGSPVLPGALMGKVIGDPADSSATLKLRGDDPADQSAFERWTREWNAWAQVDRERRPYAMFYQSVLGVMQELSARPESVELVVASGLLRLPAKTAGVDVRTHLITQHVSVEQDKSSGDLLVRLAPESSPRLEDSQLLTGLSVYESSGSRAVQEEVAKLASPVDPNILVVLKQWAGRVLSVQIDAQAEAEAGQVQSLTPQPALVLRKRGAFALLEYYEKMIAEASRDTAKVPLGLAQLVEAIEPEERVSWLQRSGSAASAAVYEDPLFPLPANREQGEIMERLGRDSGVVVEGPPGTGKTHTIANLVSSLLASGQRVLVTSEKAQALRVLRDKLPEQMQELCVSITDAGRDGSTELNRSVSEIAIRKASFSERTSRDSIERLTSVREQAFSRRTQVKEQIRALRESETFQHGTVAPGYAGTIAQVVQTITAGAASCQWLPGPLTSENPPLSAEQFRRLIELSRRTSPERRLRLAQGFPGLDAILPPATALQRLCERAGMSADTGTPASAALLRVLDGAPNEVLGRVQRQCEQLLVAIAELRRLDPSYTAAADSLLAGSSTHLWSKTTSIRALRDAAVAADNEVGSSQVESTVFGKPALMAYENLGKALSGGKKWHSRIRKSDEQKAVEALGPLPTVDGLEAKTPALIGTLTAHLRALDCVASASAVLADVGIQMSGSGTRSFLVNQLHQMSEHVELVDRIAAGSAALTATLRRIDPSIARIHSVDDALGKASAAGAIAAASDIADAERSLSDLADGVARVLDQSPSPEGRELVAVVRIGDWPGICGAMDRIDEARQVQVEERELEVLNRLLSADARSLADLIREDPAHGEWASRIDSIERAWHWRRAQTWAESQRQPGRDRQLDSELDGVEGEISRVTAELAAERAWQGCLRRMTATQVQALQSYREQITNVGKGTGKHAERFRVSARAAMRDAQGAVPAWVMPLQQVLASIPPEPDTFDVVIVDEASQADISSLFLLWLAPRVIVVGDDKQCAPSEVSSGGLDGVFDKLDVFLPDMPVYLRNGLTPRSSLFSMLRSRFGQTVRLREHFRCMPEIINWSSNQFYRDAPLIPVRQYGADRLPPLKTTYVDGGVSTGRNASLYNKPEALAIVAAIEQCLADPDYDDKTFGVVVLQGQSQVDVIRNELLSRLDVEVWANRRLRIGTPPDFQGDERHVIFLSMVIGPEHKVSAMTKNEYQRRYNVAASRAQDQLWLFHSVTADSLRSTDLRHSLMTYMQSTSPAPAAPMPEGVTRDERHKAFDSLFEQRVYLDIVARGYHVNPQVEVNYRRIDLVVTGALGQLAVECDGDSFHSSPEQLLSDIEREHELKRCGWEFWRIRESEYYLDPVEAMSGLWRALDARGITAGGVGVVVDADRQWKPVDLPDDESLAEAVEEAGGFATPATQSVSFSQAAPLQARFLGTSAGWEEMPRSVLPARPDLPPGSSLGVNCAAIPEKRSSASQPGPAQAEHLESLPTTWEVMPRHTIPGRTAPGWGGGLGDFPSAPQKKSASTSQASPSESELVAPPSNSEAMSQMLMPTRSSPRSAGGLGSRIIAAAQDGPVTPLGLAREWGLPREVVQAKLGDLVRRKVLKKLENKQDSEFELVSESMLSSLGISPKAKSSVAEERVGGDSPVELKNSTTEIDELLALLGPGGIAEPLGTPGIVEEKTPIINSRNGIRTTALFGISSEEVTITSGELAGEVFGSPHSAAVAVVRSQNPRAKAPRNGWNFWKLDDDTGRSLRHI